MLLILLTFFVLRRFAVLELGTVLDDIHAISSSRRGLFQFVHRDGNNKVAHSTATNCSFFGFSKS